MTRLAQWTAMEPSGRKHELHVDRSLFGQISVVFDRRRVPRFDRGDEGERYVMTIGSRLASIVVPPSTGGQPRLTIDGREVFGAEALLAPPDPAASQPGVSAAGISAQDLSRYQLLQRRDLGGGWFYWIAGASILNSVLYAARIDWGLVVGLGITQVIDAFAIALSHTVRTPIYAILLDILVAGIFLLFGRSARRGRLGIYALGIGVYALDGLIFIWAADWFAFAFHVFATYSLITGWLAGRALVRLERPAPAAATAAG